MMKIKFSTHKTITNNKYLAFFMGEKIQRKNDFLGFIIKLNEMCNIAIQVNRSPSWCMYIRKKTHICNKFSTCLLKQFVLFAI
jgi:hypothetical protein